MEQPIGTVHLLASTQGTADVAAVPKKMPYARTHSYQAIAGVGTGSGTATAQFYGSAVQTPRSPSTDLSDWVAIGNAINLAPNHSVQGWSSDGFSDEGAWLWVTVKFTSITGTGVQVGAWISG